MQFIDILRTQGLNMFIQIEELWMEDSMPQTKRTGIFKVKNLKWCDLRHYEFKNVTWIIPCHKGDKDYLFIQVDDKEKNYYNRN